MKKYRVLLFDFDGTLYDTTLDIARAINGTRQFYNLSEMRVSDVVKNVGNGVVHLINECFPERPSDTDTIIQHFERIYLENPADQTYEYPGLSNFLQADSHTKVVLSNKSESIIRSVLAIKNTARYFSDSIGGDTFEFKKPEVGLFKKLQERLNYEPSDFLMIGDDMPDILFAKNVGMDFIYCRHGFKKDKYSEGKMAITNFHTLNGLINGTD